MQKITGSGVMVFIKGKEEILVLLLINIRKNQQVLMEPGGRLEVGLSANMNALKELYEETFAGLSKADLIEEQKVIVHDEYICYPLQTKVDDIKFLQEVMNMNQKLISSSNNRQLHCFNECKGYILAKLKDLIDCNFSYAYKDGIKIPVHRRTKGALEEFQKSGVIQPNLTISLNCYQASLDKIRIKNPKSPLFILNNQFTYVIH